MGEDAVEFVIAAGHYRAAAAAAAESEWQ